MKPPSWECISTCGVEVVLGWGGVTRPVVKPIVVTYVAQGCVLWCIERCCRSCVVVGELGS